VTKCHNKGVIKLKNYSKKKLKIRVD